MNDSHFVKFVSFAKSLSLLAPGATKPSYVTVWHTFVGRCVLVQKYELILPNVHTPESL